MASVELGRRKRSLSDVHRSTSGSLVRHAKSVLGSQPSRQTNSLSGVSKTEIHLPAARGPRSQAAERNSFSGGMLQLQKNFGRCLLLCLECGFKDQLRYMSGCDGTMVTEVFLGGFRWRWMMREKAKPFSWEFVHIWIRSTQ